MKFFLPTWLELEGSKEAKAQTILIPQFFIVFFWKIKYKQNKSFVPN